MLPTNHSLNQRQNLYHVRYKKYFYTLNLHVRDNQVYFQRRYQITKHFNNGFRSSTYKVLLYVMISISKTCNYIYI